MRRSVLLLTLSFLTLGAGARPAGALLGNGDPDRRVYAGMWTFHFRDPGRGLDNNWLVGMSWGKLYGATFVNSFGRRAYSGGVQRVLARWEPGIVSLGLGYRAGLVTGYDERLFPLAGKTAVLPLIQPLLNVDGRASRLGLELSYSGVVASAALNVRM